MEGAGKRTNGGRVLRWQLDRDGRLLGSPEIVGDRGNPQMKRSAEAAVAAVRACEPFKLPADRYEIWRAITWSFDPAAAQ